MHASKLELLLVFTFCFVSTLSAEENNNTALAIVHESSLIRQPKCALFKLFFSKNFICGYFSVFGIGIVRFENSLCISEGLWGTCYRRSQCSSINGIGSGSCANGIGVCCICKS